MQFYHDARTAFMRNIRNYLHYVGYNFKKKLSHSRKLAKLPLYTSHAYDDEH